MARPRLPLSEAKGARVSYRLNPDYRKKIETKAKKLGLSISQYCRLAAIEYEPKKKGKS